MPVIVVHAPLSGSRGGDWTVFTRCAIVVRAKEVVHEIPTSRFHARGFAVDVIAFVVEVPAIFRGDLVWALGEVVFFEKGLDIFTRDDAGALVLQEGGGIALKDPDSVAKSFEGDACEQAAEGAADL